jgi:hypothetical protein
VVFLLQAPNGLLSHFELLLCDVVRGRLLWVVLFHLLLPGHLYNRHLFMRVHALLKALKGLLEGRARLQLAID